MSKKSSGILLYRYNNNILEVFLVHPGGPFFKNKDLGAWSIPKGEFTVEEDPYEAALREFKEETGIVLDGAGIELSPIIQKSGKQVYAWAKEGDIDESKVISNTFTIELPSKSGKYYEYPEVDRAEWFPLHLATQKINPAQSKFIDELVLKLKAS